MSAGRRGVALLLAGVALVLVAVAATGRTDVGTGGGRRPSEWVLDVAVSLLLVQLAAGAVLLVVLLVLRPQELLDPKGGPPGRRGRAAVVVGGLLLLLLAFLFVRRLATDGEGLVPGIFGGGTASAPPADASERYEPEFAPVPVVVVCTLLAVAAGAWLLAARRRRGAPEPDGALQAAMLDALEEGIDDLEAEPDPRRAVIAAYARLERVLAAHGAPRRPAEAPEEYLHRVLASLDLGRPAATRLTALFQAAKFSDHTVDETMKAGALEALRTARDELRAARERAEAERRAAVERAGRVRNA
jgi:hypothetical protein